MSRDDSDDDRLGGGGDGTDDDDDDVIHNDPALDEAGLRQKIIDSIHQSVKTAGMMKKVLNSPEAESFVKDLKKLNLQHSIMQTSIFENNVKMIQLKEGEEGDEPPAAPDGGAPAAGPSDA